MKKVVLIQKLEELYSEFESLVTVHITKYTESNSETNLSKAEAYQHSQILVKELLSKVQA